MLTAMQALKLSPDFGPHSAAFEGFVNQMERDIFQNTPNGQSRTMAPVLNIGNATPPWADQLHIMKSLEVDPNTACFIVECFRAIEPDDKVWSAFVKKFKPADQEHRDKHLNYLGTLASELSQVDMEPAGELEAGPDDTTHGQPAKYDDTYYGLSAADRKRFKCSDDVFHETYCGPVKGHAVNEDATQETWRYVPVDKDIPKKDWLQSQPVHFRMIIKTLKECGQTQVEEIANILRNPTTHNSYFNEAKKWGLHGADINWLAKITQGTEPFFDNLGTINPRIHAYYQKAGQERLAKLSLFIKAVMPPLTTTQLQVAWTYIKLARIRRGSHHYGPLHAQAEKIVRRISSAPSLAELKKLRSKIDDFQKGKLAGSRIPRNQWPLIWFRYKKRLEQLKAA